MEEQRHPIDRWAGVSTWIASATASSWVGSEAATVHPVRFRREHRRADTLPPGGRGVRRRRPGTTPDRRAGAGESRIGVGGGTGAVPGELRRPRRDSGERNVETGGLLRHPHGDGVEPVPGCVVGVHQAVQDADLAQQQFLAHARESRVLDRIDRVTGEQVAEERR